MARRISWAGTLLFAFCRSRFEFSSASGGVLHPAGIGQRNHHPAGRCTPMPPSVGHHSLARLYLRAVLPTFSAFVDGDESAGRAIRDWRFAVRFASSSGVSTTLAFRDGSVVVDPPLARGTLRLFFFSDRDVVRAFRRDGAPRALPWGALHHLGRLPGMLELLARMEEVLHDSAGNSPWHHRRGAARQASARDAASGGDFRARRSR